MEFNVAWILAFSLVILIFIVPSHGVNHTAAIFHNGNGYSVDSFSSASQLSRQTLQTTVVYTAERLVSTLENDRDSSITVRNTTNSTREDPAALPTPPPSTPPGERPPEGQAPPLNNSRIDHTDSPDPGNGSNSPPGTTGKAQKWLLHLREAAKKAVPDPKSQWQKLGAAAVTGAALHLISNFDPSLHRHLRDGHGQGQYYCPVETCERHIRGFKQRNNCINHQKRSHGNLKSLTNTEDDTEEKKEKRILAAPGLYSPIHAFGRGELEAGSLVRRSLHNESYVSPENLASDIEAIYRDLFTIEGKSLHLKFSIDVTDNTLETLRLGLGIKDFSPFFTSHSVRSLATKHNLPARIWRYGIHSWLAILEPQCYTSIQKMRLYTTRAYSSLRLLYKELPAFKTTWLQCLGDVARFRMVIEADDMQEREKWASIARGWYSQAIDKSVQDKPEKKAATIYRLYSKCLSALNVPRFERLPLDIHARIEEYLPTNDLSKLVLASKRLQKMYNIDGRRQQLVYSTCNKINSWHYDVLSPFLAGHIGNSPLNISDDFLEDSNGAEECEALCETTRGSQLSHGSFTGSRYSPSEVLLTSNISNIELGGMLDHRWSCNEEDWADSEMDVAQAHPLYEYYLSRLGEVDLYRERHSDLISQHEFAHEAQRFRRSVGLELQPENQAALDSFAVEEAKISGEIRQIERDIQRLKTEIRQEARINEWEDGESGILQVSDLLDETDQAGHTKYSGLMQQLESTGLLEIADSTVESRLSSDSYTSEFVESLDVPAVQLDHYAIEQWSLPEPNGDWLRNFLETPMSSNEIWPDFSEFEMYGDINDQHEPNPQVQNAEQLEMFDFREETLYIDPSLTVMTQSERPNDISPDLKEPVFSLSDKDSATMIVEFSSTPSNSTSCDIPRNLHQCTSCLKVPLSLPQSPPSPKTSSESPSSPKIKPSSSNENANKCAYCNRTFSRLGDLRKHLKYHTKPVCCPEPACEYTCARDQDLRRHQNSIHRRANEGQRHGCPVGHCGLTFSRRDNLLRHVRIVHEGR